MKNSAEKNAKSGVRFNILDAIIILLLILAVLGVSFRHTLIRALGFSEEMSEYSVSFSLSAVSYTLPGFLKEGDILYFSTGERVGELLGVASFSSHTNKSAGSDTLILKPASKYIRDSEDRAVLAEYPEFTHVDAIGAFLCEGSAADGYFRLGGEQYLAVGQKITLYTDTVTLHMIITGITTVS